MKHKFTTIIIALAGLGVALATHANAVTLTYNFLENGSNLDLGATSTFTEGGFSLIANAFLTAGGPTDLFAKSAGVGETGLGTAFDPNHEINTTNFVQLTLPTSPPSTFNMVLLASVQAGEQANVYFTHTSGTLNAATFIGSISGHDGSITVPPGDQTGFIDITAGAANVLLHGAQITTAVPEPSSLAFLALGAGGILTLHRRRKAASK